MQLDALGGMRTMHQKRPLRFERDRARALIKETSWFRRANDTLLDDITDLAGLAAVPRGEILFRSGDPIDNVILPFTGKADILVDMPTGEQILFAYVTPLEWLGDPVVMKGTRHWLTVQCKEDFTAFFFELSDFSRILRCHPEVYEDILTGEVERRKNIFDLMCSRLPHSTEQRLASRLLQIVRTLPQAQNKRVTLPANINQVELARSVITCRQTVNRILATWTRAGILLRSGPCLVVDIARLQERITVDL